MRQAFLIAARDELGLATRDAVLGDWRSSDAETNDATAELAILFQPGKSSRAWVRRTGRAAGEILVESDLKEVSASPTDHRRDDLIGLVQIAESLSRKEFRDVLRRLGPTGHANEVRPDASVPDGVDERLTRLGYTESFQALRLLHRAQRSDGESPARLGALVRGYALLGLLTEFHWHPAHEAFKARSLLYAQRLVARDPRQPWGFWHRAFAEALAGLHTDALSDLVQAKAWTNVEKATVAPEWAGVIEAAAVCDLAALNAQRGRMAPLAALLRMAEIETEGAPSLSVRAAGEVLTVDRACVRAIDAMLNRFGIEKHGPRHSHGPKRAQGGTLRPAEVDRRPSRGRCPTDRCAGRRPVCVSRFAGSSRHRAANRDEPSWGVLGQLVRETSFVQAYRRLSFLTTFRPGSVDDYWSKASASIADHQFRQVLESLVALGGKHRSTRNKPRELISLPDLGIAEREILRSGAIPSGIETRIIRTAISAHVDHVARELSLLIAEGFLTGEVDQAHKFDFW